MLTFSDQTTSLRCMDQEKVKQVELEISLVGFFKNSIYLNENYAKSEFTGFPTNRPLFPVFLPSDGSRTFLGMASLNLE